MIKKISFISNRAWLNKKSHSVPIPTTKTLPEWYKKADRFHKNINGEYFKAPKEFCPFTNSDVGEYGKIPTYKACPSLFDIMTTGYFLRTPCDIEFFINDNNIIDCKVLDKQFDDFIQKRGVMQQFITPNGYHDIHFAFWADWNVKLPIGYSALYISPANRFDLPFITTQGIIDNDNLNISGTLPFFVSKNFIGVVPAGTPYMQIIPFKRENWESEIIIEEPNIIYYKNMENIKKHRVPNGGTYKNKTWQPRKYK